MNKKYLILIVLLIVVFGGIFAYFNLSDGSFSNSKMTVPDGFEVTRQNDSEIVFTNGETNYSIIELPASNDMTYYIKECVSKYDENDTVVNKTFTFNDIPTEAVILKNDNNKTVHAYYFFEKNNKKYQLFSKGEYNKEAIESIVNSTV